MSDTCGCFRSEEVSPRRFEEFQDGLVLPRGRIRHIDDNLRARKRLRQSFAGDGVDARGGRGSDDLMPCLTKVVDHFCSDEASAFDDYDYHLMVPVEFGRGNARDRDLPQRAICLSPMDNSIIENAILTLLFWCETR